MGSTPGPRSLEKLYVDIISQNVRGFSHSKEEDLLTRLQERRIWAACLQETWRTSREAWENRGFIFLHNGLAEKPCTRGAQGVAIILAPAAQKAWQKAGEQRLYFGSRIIATRLELLDAAKRTISIYLVSSYAPDSGRPQTEHVEYEGQLQRCLEECRRHEILVVGTDANASLGIRSRHNDVGSP